MPDIRHAIAIDVPPELVFPLVSTGRGFTQWWAADVSEAGADGTVELGFFQRSTIYRLKPVRLAAPREAEWLCESGKEWQGTRLRFELAESQGKTLLRFTHADWQADTDYYVSCTTTWGELMFRLKAAAEGKSPGPLFSAGGMAY
jgi:uncharacterized protein YndB with AHSA1/START domain